MLASEWEASSVASEMKEVAKRPQARTTRWIADVDAAWTAPSIATTSYALDGQEFEHCFHSRYTLPYTSFRAGCNSRPAVRAREPRIGVDPVNSGADGDSPDGRKGTPGASRRTSMRSAVDADGVMRACA